MTYKIMDIIGYGLRISAYKHLITVDPIFHVYKLSGTSISKIDRGTEAVIDFVLKFYTISLRVLITMIVTIVAILSSNPLIGISGYITYTNSHYQKLY